MYYIKHFKKIWKKKQKQKQCVCMINIFTKYINLLEPMVVGWDNWIVNMIEPFKCETKSELTTREGFLHSQEAIA